MAVLRVEKLRKAFAGQMVLDGLSFALERQERVVVFGLSGAGKTVLLRVLAGLYESDAGHIFCDDVCWDGVPPELRSIGMAFQNFALFPHWNSFDNIAVALRGRCADGDVQRRVMALASLLQIESVLDHFPRELSNGQKQRTALARALVAQPQLLLLDDPLRNVDARLRFEMRLELPRVLAESASTVLYVTQDYREAMALGQRVLVLVAGQLLQFDSPAVIYQRPCSVAVAQLFGDPTINLLPLTWHQQGLDIGAGQPWRWPGAIELADESPCLLGVRPEQLLFCSAQDSAAMALQIAAVTPVNEKQIILAHDQQGRELLISRPSGEQLPQPGDEAWVRMAPDAGLLFARHSGALLAVAGQ